MKPITGSSSRIDTNNNSIYNGLNQQISVNKAVGKNQSSRQISKISYTNNLSPIKIGKSSYFTNNHASLWYFKEGSKNVFKAPLQSIEAGFERNELNISFVIP